MERWKKFEQDVQSYLTTQAITRPLVLHRFYDTRSAGASLPTQPGDFLVIYNGSPILLELKSSETHDSLRGCFSSAVPATQVAFHMLWKRAGAETWILFLGADGRYELWPFFSYQRAKETGRPLKIGDQRTFSKLNNLLEAVLDYNTGC